MEDSGWSLHYSGICEPNPGGNACYGWALLENGRLRNSGKGFACAGHGASNISAEYYALLAALEFLVSRQMTDVAVVIRGSLQLVVNQVNGVWQVGSQALAPLHARAAELFRQFPNARLEWIRGEENPLARRLSREALRLSAGGQPEHISSISEDMSEGAAADAAQASRASRQTSLAFEDSPRSEVLQREREEAPVDARLSLIRRVEAVACEAFGSDVEQRDRWHQEITGVRAYHQMSEGHLRTLLACYAYRKRHQDRYDGGTVPDVAATKSRPPQEPSRSATPPASESAPPWD